MKLTELHDWEIRCVEAEHESKSANLYIHHSETRRNLIIRILGIKRFYASDMMLQNVILDVLMLKPNSSSGYLEHCKNLLNLADVTFDRDDIIFYIEPSVGVEIACLCHSVELSEVSS